jgi:hypothetical protein
MRAVAAALAASALAGCAFGDVEVRAPSAKDVSTGSHRGAGREIALQRPFLDHRAQDRCGMKKNGYNMDTAKVTCSQAPADTIAYLVAHELWAAGFKVLDDPAKAGPSTIVLSGTVEQAFVEPKLNFSYAVLETDVSLLLTARTGAGLVAERRFFVKGEEATVTASDEDIQRSYESGLRQLVTAVVSAVANLADHVPADGAPPASEEAR